MNQFKVSILIVNFVLFSFTQTAYADASASWTHAFDFDGDGNKDVIGYKFTGGAHCCYKISVTLSSSKKTYHFPFQLDGGYVGGLDLSQPKRFSIYNADRALPEIVMEIETFNGKQKPLPIAWKQKYGFKTHYIAISFPDGMPHIRDKQRKKLIEQQHRLMAK